MIVYLARYRKAHRNIFTLSSGIEAQRSSSPSFRRAGLTASVNGLTIEDPIQLVRPSFPLSCIAGSNGLRLRTS